MILMKDVFPEHYRILEVSVCEDTSTVRPWKQTTQTRKEQMESNLSKWQMTQSIMPDLRSGSYPIIQINPCLQKAQAY